MPTDTTMRAHENERRETRDALCAQQAHAARRCRYATIALRRKHRRCARGAHGALLIEKAAVRLYAA
jgi:hypothetical protein